MQWIYHTAEIAPFTVATTEAPSYRRMAIEMMREGRRTGEQIRRSPVARAFGIRGGHGVMFVSHSGDVCPSGFLPVPLGNVRQDRVATLYRQSDLFWQLHHPEDFAGRCGECEFHALMRRLAGEGLCGDGQSAGDGSVLRLSAACAGLASLVGRFVPE